MGKISILLIPFVHRHRFLVAYTFGEIVAINLVLKRALDDLTLTMRNGARKFDICPNQIANKRRSKNQTGNASVRN